MGVGSGQRDTCEPSKLTNFGKVCHNAFMSTVNISLTSDQVKLVDHLTKALDFANRSEFFRALLRLLAHKPELLAKADEIVLEAPKTKSLSKIKSDLRVSGRYSPQFISSVAEGLSESGYFEK